MWSAEAGRCLALVLLVAADVVAQQLWLRSNSTGAGFREAHKPISNLSAMVSWLVGSRCQNFQALHAIPSGGNPFSQGARAYCACLA